MGEKIFTLLFFCGSKFIFITDQIDHVGWLILPRELQMVQITTAQKYSQGTYYPMNLNHSQVKTEKLRMRKMH